MVCKLAEMFTHSFVFSHPYKNKRYLLLLCTLAQATATPPAPTKAVTTNDCRLLRRVTCLGGFFFLPFFFCPGLPGLFIKLQEDRTWQPNIGGRKRSGQNVRLNVRYPYINVCFANNLANLSVPKAIPTGNICV